MRKITTTLLVLFLAMLHMTMAQNNWVGITSSKPAEASIHLLESNIQQTNIQFSVEGYFEHAIRTPRGSEMILSLQNGVNITEAGMPDLPKLYTTIIIPDLYEMDVKVISYKYEEYSNIAIAPSKGHFTRDIRPEDVPFIYGEAYNEDAFWPGELAQLEDPFIMRDFRGQTVTIFPFQYNPVSQILRVYTDIVVEVNATDQPGRDALVRKRDEINIEKDFGFIYDRFFLNMEAASKNYQVLEGEEGSMLIIAYDSFMDAMQPFVDWKRTTGRKTVMVPKSEAGNTAAAIKSYVQNYYDENPDFAHLLLIGDGPQIPPMNASGGQSDNAYGFLVGTNSYNDIFVGRFSAETVAHVETQVERMIHYERDLDETATWLSRGMGVARNEGTGGGHNGGENDYQHMDFIRDTLLNYTYTEVLKRYDGNVPGVPNTNAAQMSGDFNEGIGIVNFCNHGSVTGWSVANYSISHVNQLTNINMLPFIWSVACVNGNFVNNFCFAEAWMRATHEGQPTGAIGTMMSTINQLWQPPMTGQDEMVTLLAEMSIFPNVNTFQRTFGGLSINGSMAMIPAHGTAGINTHQTWILFGDPTLKVRTEAPSPMSVTYNPVILLGSESFTVNVDDAEGATVTLSYYDLTEEEVVIVGTGAVEGGMVTVDFDVPVTEPGVLTLAIMSFNKITYLNEELQVIPPDGPYVVFDYYEIDDSQGNNNNQADYGETIILNVSLKNVGIEKAENVTATLTTESEYITILENEAFWGEIIDDENLLINAAFTFEVNHVIPDNHNILFTLEIAGQDENEEVKDWSSNFGLRIYSPMFSISQYVLDDSAGNNNGLLEPGETADLIVTYTNTGGAPAMAPVAQMIVSNPYLTVLEDVVEPGIVAAGDNVEITYTVQANASTIEGTFVELIFTIEDAHAFESEQLLIIGQTPETTIGDGTTPSVQYPFYNYYKANRSQMIYTAEELGAGEKTILEIGYDIIQVATQHNNLPNFVIRMMHVEQNAFGAAFINTADAEVVFQAEAYQMPTATGWHTWEIEHFEYDGESNLLIEIVWGILPQWTSPFYRVASTNVGANRTAYGFSDTQAVPNYSGNTAVRPNLYLAFASEELEPSQMVEFVLSNQLGEELQDAEVKVGSMKMFTDEAGLAHISLQPGAYFVSAKAYSHESIVNHEFVIETTDNGDKEDDIIADVTVELMLIRQFNATFNITDKYGHDVTDAVISINDHDYEEGHYEMWYMMPGEYTYTISRDTYHDYEGSFELIDDHAIMDIELQPDGTDITEITQNGISVFPNPFSNQLNLQMAEGIKGDIQVVDVLGNVVLTRTSATGSSTLNLAHLPVGNYFVRIITSDRTEVFKVSRVK
ncbi:MAG: T9SS C-terminal target domain-containing protein [Bacteroidetes bacterium]|nr:MAG: T9SS C-terminal target domain-containing protein [Bacteroidota bacterium]